MIDPFDYEPRFEARLRAHAARAARPFDAAAIAASATAGARRGGLHADRRRPPRRHDPGELRRLRRCRPRRRGRGRCLAHRLAQARRPPRARRLRPWLVSIAANEARQAVRRRRAARRRRAGDAGRRGRLGRSGRASRRHRPHQRVGPSRPRGPRTPRPALRRRVRRRRNWAAPPVAPRPGRAPASPACSGAFERSSAMTDRTDFETMLERRMRAYAATAVRPVPAHRDRPHDGAGPPRLPVDRTSHLAARGDRRCSSAWLRSSCSPRSPGWPSSAVGHRTIQGVFVDGAEPGERPHRQRRRPPRRTRARRGRAGGADGPRHDDPAMRRAVPGRT